MTLTNLNAADLADFKTHTTKAIECLGAASDKYQEFLDHLIVIKNRELWRANHSSWTAFLDFIAETVGKKRRRFYDLVRAQEVRLKLVQTLHKKSPILRKIGENMSSQALLALSKVAPEDREKVVEEAAKQFDQGKAPTAPAVAAAAKVQERKAKAKEPDKPAPTPLDSTGTKIPGPALPFWERRNEVQPWLNQISEIKCAIEKAKKSGDSLYAWIGTPAIDALQNAFTTIANAKLYAVCTKCQGWWDRMSGGGCSTCHNTGLICKHQYEVCSPKEIKDMREKSDKKA